VSGSGLEEFASSLLLSFTVNRDQNCFFTIPGKRNVMVGIMTGLGTIDRMKQRLQSTTNNSEDPLELEDIFGIGNYLTWLFPIDPIFSDYDDVLRYSMPQRLLREGSDSISEC